LIPRATHKFRQYDEKLLNHLFNSCDDEDSLIQLAHRARHDLESIYELDQASFEEKENDWPG